MAGLEGGAGEDAALLLSPGGAVAVGGAGVFDQGGLRAVLVRFPTVPELQNIGHNLMGASGEVVLAVSIVIATQTTHMTLVLWVEFNGQTGLHVPHEDDPGL